MASRRPERKTGSSYAGTTGPRLAFLVFTSLTVAACTPFGENKLIERGIGTDLYSSDVRNESRLQDQYFVQMCVQGGVELTNDGTGVSCNPVNGDGSSWTNIVKAGFNDIDRRCDSYLAWLNNKRKTNTAILSQLSQTGTATDAILGIAKASANSLVLVSLAFGLARDTFTNYYSRLLLEVESSTVELLVSERRQEFRAAFTDANAAVQSKPDAVHLLRSYLLICTPHVIENNINTRTRFSIAGVQKLPQDDDAEQVIKSTTGRALLRSIPTGGAKAQVTTTPSGGVVGRKFLIQSIRLTTAEKAMPEGTPAKIQRALCVDPADGVFGKNTRVAIVLAKQGLIKRRVDFIKNENDTLSSDALVGFFKRQSSCENHEMNWSNAYEKYAYPTLTEMKRFQSLLAKCHAVLQQKLKNDTSIQPSPLASGRFDDETRKMITSVRSESEKHSQLSTGETISGTISRNFQEKLSTCLTL